MFSIHPKNRAAILAVAPVDFDSPQEAMDFLVSNGEDPEHYEIKEWCKDHRLGECSECGLYVADQDQAS